MQVWVHLHACFRGQGLRCQCFKAAIPDHLSIEAAVSCIVDLQAREHGVSSMAASDGLCRPKSIHESDRGNSYLFKEDAEEQWADCMALVSVDMDRELLHVIAAHMST